MATSVQLLTVAEVCQQLRVGKSKVFELIATGELESLKIDTARRFTQQQVADFIDRQVDAAKAAS